MCVCQAACLCVCVCAHSSLTLALALPTSLSLALVSCVLRNCQPAHYRFVCVLSNYRLLSTRVKLKLVACQQQVFALRVWIKHVCCGYNPPSPAALSVSLSFSCSLQTGILIGISIWAPKSRRGHSTWQRDTERHTHTHTHT